MKLFAMLSAAVVTVSPLAASAQMHHESVTTRTVVRTAHRGDARPRTRRVCTVSYRHHHRVRTCRTVRY